MSNVRNIPARRVGAAKKSVSPHLSQDHLQGLFNGLIVSTGKPVPVAASSITKSTMKRQLREEQAHGPEVVSDNSRNRGLRISTERKSKFSTHRRMSFLPQE